MLKFCGTVSNHWARKGQASPHREVVLKFEAIGAMAMRTFVS